MIYRKTRSAKTWRETSLLIDARRAERDRTGVGNYVRAIIDSWPTEEPGAVALVSSDDASFNAGSVVSKNLGRSVLWHVRAAVMSLRAGAAYFSPESLLVPILLGHRSVLTVHDITPITHPQQHTFKNRLVHNLLLGLAIRRVRRIATPTDAVTAELQKAYPRYATKMVTVTEGLRALPTGAEDSHRDLREPYILYVGTVEPRKNVLIAIEAFLEAAPDPFKFIITGKIGWLSASERATFLKLIGSDRVEHLGYVPDEALHHLYEHASAFVYVSEAEGFGLPVLEALSYGLPVIHSDDPALVEVARGHGLEVPLASLRKSLGQAFSSIDELIEEDTSRVRARRSHAMSYNWSTTAQSLRNLALDLA